MRTGVVLPTFRDTPDEAFAAAEEAVGAGVDGVFCYDHIWPMGQPHRPALAPFPVLGALATRLAPAAATAGAPSSARSWHGSAWCRTPCCSRSTGHSSGWHRGV